MPFLFIYILSWLFGECAPAEKNLLLWQIIVWLVDTDLFFLWLIYWHSFGGERSTRWFRAENEHGQRVMTYRAGAVLLAFMMISCLVAVIPGVLAGRPEAWAMAYNSFFGAIIIPIVLSAPVLIFAQCWRRDLITWRRFFDAKRSRRGAFLAAFTSTVVMIGTAALATYFVISLVTMFWA